MKNQKSNSATIEDLLNLYGLSTDKIISKDLTAKGHHFISGEARSCLRPVILKTKKLDEYKKWLNMDQHRMVVDEVIQESTNRSREAKSLATVAREYLAGMVEISEPEKTIIEDLFGPFQFPVYRANIINIVSGQTYTISASGAILIDSLTIAEGGILNVTGNSQITVTTLVKTGGNTPGVYDIQFIGADGTPGYFGSVGTPGQAGTPGAGGTCNGCGTACTTGVNGNPGGAGSGGAAGTVGTIGTDCPQGVTVTVGTLTGNLNIMSRGGNGGGGGAGGAGGAGGNGGAGGSAASCASCSCNAGTNGIGGNGGPGGYGGQGGNAGNGGTVVFSFSAAAGGTVTKYELSGSGGAGGAGGVGGNAGTGGTGTPGTNGGSGASGANGTQSTINIVQL